MIVEKSPRSVCVLPGPAREQRVAAEQQRRALDARSRSSPGVCPGVWTVRTRSRPTSRDVVVLEQVVVALEHPGVLGAHRDLVARRRAPRRRRRCGPSARGSRRPTARRARRHTSSSRSCSLAASISSRVAGRGGSARRRRCSRSGPTTRRCTSTAASSQIRSDALHAHSLPRRGLVAARSAVSRSAGRARRRPRIEDSDELRLQRGARGASPDGAAVPGGEVPRDRGAPAHGDDEGYDPAVWRQMADQLGLQAMIIPEALRRRRASATSSCCVVLEEMGAALLCAPYFSTVALATNALLTVGDEVADEAAGSRHRVGRDDRDARPHRGRRALGPRRDHDERRRRRDDAWTLERRTRASSSTATPRR